MASDPRCTCLNCGYGVVPHRGDRYHIARWDTHPYSDEDWQRILAFRYAMVERAWLERLLKRSSECQPSYYRF